MIDSATSTITFADVRPRFVRVGNTFVLCRPSAVQTTAAIVNRPDVVVYSPSNSSTEQSDDDKLNAYLSGEVPLPQAAQAWDVNAELRWTVDDNAAKRPRFSPSVMSAPGQPFCPLCPASSSSSPSSFELNTPPPADQHHQQESMQERVDRAIRATSEYMARVRNVVIDIK